MSITVTGQFGGREDAFFESDSSGPDILDRSMESRILGEIDKLVRLIPAEFSHYFRNLRIKNNCFIVDKWRDLEMAVWRKTVSKQTKSVIVDGVSGSGKTTISEKLLEDRPDRYESLHGDEFLYPQVNSNSFGSYMDYSAASVENWVGIRGKGYKSKVPPAHQKGRFMDWGSIAQMLDSVDQINNLASLSTVSDFKIGHRASYYDREKGETEDRFRRFRFDFGKVLVADGTGLGRLAKESQVLVMKHMDPFKLMINVLARDFSRDKLVENSNRVRNRLKETIIIMVSMIDSLGKADVIFCDPDYEGLAFQEDFVTSSLSDFLPIAKSALMQIESEIQAYPEDTTFFEYGLLNSKAVDAFVVKYIGEILSILSKLEGLLEEPVPGSEQIFAIDEKSTIVF